MESKDKKVFYVIIVLALVIVAIVGGSFAYFVSTTGSTNNAVEVKSATVTINYTEGTSVKADNLIPTSKTIANSAFHNTNSYGVCVDKNGYDVCSSLSFTIANGASATSITAKLNIKSNEFTNLHFMVLDSDDNVVTDDTSMGTATGNVTIVDEDSLTANQSKTYNLIVWLNETSETQDEQNKSFQGDIVVNTSDNLSGQVTGDY